MHWYRQNQTKEEEWRLRIEKSRETENDVILSTTNWKVVHVK